jgi:hypothetical protein
MYALHNNSGMFTRIWPSTFVNSTSDLRVIWDSSNLHKQGYMAPVWMKDYMGIPHVVEGLAGDFPTQSFPCTKSHVRLHAKCPLLSSDLKKNCNVQTNFSKIHKNQTSWKSDQPLLKMLHADWQTDISKLRGTILQILVTNTPKNME